MKWTVCENHAGWYVEGVAPNGGAIAVSAFGIPENEARLIVSNHELQEQVKLLREALALCESRLMMPWVERHLSTEVGDLTDLGEALRDIRTALEATKDAP